MKKISIFSFILASVMVQGVFANAIPKNILICTFTKNQFGAKSELVGSFPFVTTPGYLPIAKGSFQIPEHRIVIAVSSTLIDSENVQTSMKIKIGKTYLSTSFNDTRADQRAYFQVNDDGVAQCSAE